MSAGLLVTKIGYRLSAIGYRLSAIGYRRQLSNGTVNAISAAEFVNMGHAASFSDNLVGIEPAL